MARTPTAPLWVLATAVKPAGSIPINGTRRSTLRRWVDAAAEAVLQATTMMVAPRPSRRRAIWHHTLNPPSPESKTVIRPSSLSGSEPSLTYEQIEAETER